LQTGLGWHALAKSKYLYGGSPRGTCEYGQEQLRYHSTNNKPHARDSATRGCFPYLFPPLFPQREKQTAAMSVRNNLHVGVFIPSTAQLLDTACVDVFAISSRQYLSLLPMVPSHISCLAPEIKISYIGSQKPGKIPESKTVCLPLL
jgi:hypothetical protein